MPTYILVFKRNDEDRLSTFESDNWSKMRSELEYLVTEMKEYSLVSLTVREA
jgi:hypothetical protein